VITEKTGVIAPIPENIPLELTERPQWVCWRYEERHGKLTKVLYEAETGRRASSTDLKSWGAFDAARGAYEASDGRYSGIGFVFCSGDPYVGIDLDKCRDPESGEIKSWATEIISRVRGAYIEISPSGTGIHIIVQGSVRDGGMRKGNVEMYSRGRFFTITGRTL
jgi:putative DNA primase/helicase